MASLSTSSALYARPRTHVARSRKISALTVCYTAPKAGAETKRATAEDRLFYSNIFKKAGTGLASVAAAAAITMASVQPACAEKIGEFNASGLIFKDSVQVFAIPDPKVSGVTIWIADYSRSLSAKMSKDFFSEPSQASITCGVTGPVSVNGSLGGADGEEVFSEGKSLFQTKAEATTIPLDTAKVRLQLQGMLLKPGETPKYKGLFGTVSVVAREEGAAALWKGLTPGLHRQCLFGGLRIGLYEPVKQAVVGADHVGPVPLLQKIAAGLFTGSLAISIASPTDLVKVRMQAEGKLAPGMPKKYPSAIGAYRTIAAEEGIAGLWKGVGPNIGRNAIINAAELASYDQVKQMLLDSGAFEDNTACHIMSGLGAGFVAVCVGSPVDVVKSRVMGDKAGKYTGMANCFAKTFAEEGIFAFYRGFAPNFARLGSWNVVMFLSLEKVRKFYLDSVAAH